MYCKRKKTKYMRVTSGCHKKYILKILAQFVFILWSSYQNKKSENIVNFLHIHGYFRHTYIPIYMQVI